MSHRSGWRNPLWIALALLTGSAVSQAHPSHAPIPSVLTDHSRWTLSWSPDVARNPQFRGLNNRDGAGVAQGAILYPGSTVGVLLISVLTHAALTAGAVRREMQTLQERADQVLVPHADVLAKFASEDLLDRTRAHLHAMASSFGGGLVSEAQHASWQLEVRPLFWMSQDRQAIVADVVALLKATGVPAAERRAAVRVISSPHAAADATELWNAQDGALLKSQAAQLLALGVHHLMNEWVHGEVRPVGAARTVRFPLGGEEQIERAQVLEQRCARMLLRRLNGELLSAPVDATSGSGPPCAWHGPER